MFCQHKDFFGKPGEGVHSYRFMGVAIVDVFMTLLVAFILSKKLDYTFKNTAIVLFILGILAHRMFCVETAVDKFLFNP